MNKKNSPKTIPLPEKPQLTDKELQALRTFKGRGVQLKVQLAELELEKDRVIGEIRDIQAGEGGFFKNIVEKYGEGCTFNIDTGEITKKPGLIVN